MSSLVTITGPTCSGKTTLASLLVKSCRFRELVSTTTRPMRPGEVSGKNYHFIDPEGFAFLEASGAFVETISKGGHKYGMSKAEVGKISGPSVVVVDPFGCRQMREHCQQVNLPVLSVFITAPLEILLQRFFRERVNGDFKAAARRCFELVTDESMWQLKAQYDRVFPNHDGLEATARIVGAISSWSKGATRNQATSSSAEFAQAF